MKKTIALILIVLFSVSCMNDTNQSLNRMQNDQDRLAYSMDRVATRVDKYETYMQSIAESLKAFESLATQLLNILITSLDHDENTKPSETPDLKDILKNKKDDTQ